MLDAISNSFLMFKGAALLALGLWWLWGPLLLFSLLVSTWEGHSKEKTISGLEWVILKIKPPPLVDRSLKGVEQFFAGLHGAAGSAINRRERILQGKLPEWFSLEIVGEEGSTDFYIRTLTSYRNLIEANIFAQYPDAEITVVEDYLKRLPKNLPNEEYDLSGGEVALAKDNAYPILTYEYFQEKPAKKEDLTIIDPLSTVAEIFATFRAGEWFVMQWIIRPVGDDWVKKDQAVLDKIMGKEPKGRNDWLDKLMAFIDGLMGVKAEEKKEDKKDKVLNFAEKEAVEAIQKKFSKLGYECGLRLGYIAKKEVFHRYHMTAINGALKQFNSGMLNSFKGNKAMGTKSDGKMAWLFPFSGKGFGADKITFAKKVDFYKNLRGRALAAKSFILGTDELATVWHLPGEQIKAPLFPRVEAKKGQPPSNLDLVEWDN